MNPNPILRQLGYSNNDRLLIIHTDDIGMCHASTQAYIELVESGLICSGATMVPCSWFPKVAQFCRQNPNVDMGVHITLTSEWDTYRWSPISTHQQASGMLDTEGYFYRRSEDTQTKGNPEALQIEIKAQLDRALKAGVEVTHVDTHMGTVAHPKFVMSYIYLAIQHKIPFLFPRLDKNGFMELGLDQDTATLAANYVNTFEEQGIPLVDHATGLDLDKPQSRFVQAQQAMHNLQPGITHFVIHPSIETPELVAITLDWQSRVADYQTFMDEKLRKYIIEQGIQVIGYKTLKSVF